MSTPTGTQPGDVAGMATLQRNLAKLPAKLQKKHNRAAVRKGAAPIAKDYRKRVKAPTKKQREKLGGKGRTGLMAKSVAVKVKATPGRSTAVAIIGHKRSVSGDGYGGKHVPANIAHLVEGGHGGPKPAPPHPSLRPAYDSKKGESQKLIGQSLWQSITSEVERPR